MNSNIDNNGDASVSEEFVDWVNEGILKDYGVEITDEMKENNALYQAFGTFAISDYGPLGAMKTLKERTSAWTKLDKAQITLPTKEQINNAFTDSMPSWLYGNLNLIANMAYWTSTAYDTEPAFVVKYNELSNDGLVCTGTYQVGIRPVITISKANLS